MVYIYIYICFFNWRIIALHCFVGFCPTTWWISHKYTYVPPPAIPLSQPWKEISNSRGPTHVRLNLVSWLSLRLWRHLSSVVCSQWLLFKGQDSSRNLVQPSMCRALGSSLGPGSNCVEKKQASKRPQKRASPSQVLATSCLWSQETLRHRPPI